MLKKICAVLAILLAVSACESTSEETGATTGSGTGGNVPSAASSSTGMSSGMPTTSMPLPSVGGSGQRGGMGPAETERELSSSGDTVYFAFDSYSLDSRAQETLDRQAALLLRNNGVNVTIEGHTDERGTREYNLALGERRATAVKDYLVAFGISPARIRTLSYGEERPAVLGSNEAAWAKNRRAVTIVTGGVAGS